MNLQNILDACERQKWSVDDFDWDSPVQMEGVSKKQQRYLAYVLLFIAGVERAGAEFFKIHADYVDDPIASKVFNVFAEDEKRHAAAERAMAKRLGVGWDDLPWITRYSFKFINKDMEKLRKSAYGSGIHRFGSTMILFAELGLDGIVMPTLRQGMNEPLQDEVWKKIDQDERRHIAVDYWLIENRYKRDKALNEQLAANPKLKKKNRGPRMPVPLRSLLLTPAVAIPGFLPVARSLAAMPVKGSFFGNYWRLVQAVPQKAPHAEDLPAYNVPKNAMNRIARLFEKDEAAASQVA